MKTTLFCITLFFLSLPSGMAQGDLFKPKRLVETKADPILVSSLKDVKDVTFIDFGKAAFGTIEFQASSADGGEIVSIHLGEVISKDEKRINRNPGGSRRYRKMTQALKKGTHWYRVSITPDKRNTKKMAILMPDYIGEVMPFRYCELEAYPGKLEKNNIKQIRVPVSYTHLTLPTICSV